MNIKDQVCSFEFAKKLKELGVKQESYFYWYTDGLNRRIETETDYIRGVYGYGGSADAVYSAFTVAELGEMLPNHIHKDSSTYWLWYGKMHAWEVSYCTSDDEFLAYVEEETEASARAKMLVYLIMNMLISDYIMEDK